jgi:site-specific recombinase XerD
MAHLFQPKNSKKYCIRFRKTVSGKKLEKVVATGLTAQRHALVIAERLEKDFDLGTIDIFSESFDYEQWLQNSDGKSTFAAITLEKAIAAFLDESTHRKASTLKNYKDVLSLFERHIGSNVPTCRIADRDVIKFLKSRTISVVSIHSYLRMIRAFATWIEKKQLGPNFAKGIKWQKPEDNLAQKIIRESDLDKLIEVHTSLKSKQEEIGNVKVDAQRQLWFAPLITTAFYSGLRRGEITQLRWRHVDLENRQIRLLAGKTSRGRVIPIIDALYNVLTAWKAKVMPKSLDQFVFESVTSSPGKSIPMDGHNITHVFSHVRKHAGLSDTVCFHSLRHSFATFMVRSGMDVETLRKLLEHKSILITQVYLHVEPSDIARRIRELGLIKS